MAANGWFLNERFHNILGISMKYISIQNLASLFGQHVHRFKFNLIINEINYNLLHYRFVRFPKPGLSQTSHKLKVFSFVLAEIVMQIAGMAINKLLRESTTKPYNLQLSRQDRHD